MKRYLFLIVIQIALLFTAQGQFTYHQKIDFASFAPMVNIADYNLDGYNDILFDQYDAKNEIYYNDNSVNFTTTNTLSLPFDGPVSTYSTDLDNDLDIDIISTSIGGNLLIYENINGTISNATTIFPGSIFFTGFSGQLIATADLDSNGTTDIVTSRAGGYGQLTRHTNIGSLQFQTDTISNTRYSQFILADINGNGYKDIITIGGDVFINSLGIFNTVTNITNGSTCGKVVAADIDSDNDLDIITFYADTIKYLKNDGAGNFTNTVIINSNVPNIKSVVVGDMDNDGFEDLICSADSLFWYKNDGVGNLDIQSTINTSLNSGFLNVADLDNDNDLDIILQNGDSTNIFLNNFVMISSISIQGQGSVSIINTLGGSLQMEANILPLNAGNTNITWSVVNGTGSATISSGGLFTAVSDGTATAIATANDGSGVVGTFDVAISNQTTGIDSQIACDSYLWINGITYSSSNNSTRDTIFGAAFNGRDSIITLDLTIITSGKGTDIKTACDSLTWIDGITYTSSNNTAADTIFGGAANGCDSITTLDLTISNLNSTYLNSDNGNGNYSFTNTSSGSFNQSHWAFGDGNIVTTTNPNHTFNTNGTFVTVLTVKDSITDCFDYFIDTIAVTGVPSPAKCNAGFVMYSSSSGNITIVNSSKGTNLTYLWDFGDGNTSTLANPTHTYSNTGPFYLCLTVHDGNGCVNQYCDSIGINGVVFNKAAGFNISVISAPIITGINNEINSNSEINIYPNPTSNQLTIDTELTISKIDIIDIAGKKIMTTKDNKSNINVTNLSEGIYFIQLVTEEGIITEKFVKQ